MSKIKTWSERERDKKQKRWKGVSEREKNNELDGGRRKKKEEKRKQI